jgi:hypothetical protein
MRPVLDSNVTAPATVDQAADGWRAGQPGVRRVSIFVCGVQKAGTTTLDAFFCEHPDLSAAIVKELNFFNDEKIRWKKTNYGKLDRKFSRSVRGERFDVTPVYAFWPDAIERIKAYNPNARLIYIFRDPFDRAWSHWCMVYGRKKEKQLFADAIRGGRRRLSRMPPKAKRREIYTYIERGQYADQVRRALANFPREQLLFLRFEDLIKDHKATLAVIAEFLKIGPFPDLELKKENPRPAVTDGMKPTQADRDLIYDLLRDDVLEFSELTGLDVSNWATVLRTPAT